MNGPYANGYWDAIVKEVENFSQINMYGFEIARVLWMIHDTLEKLTSEWKMMKRDSQGIT